MNDATESCIHERADRRMEPFYWILTFEAMAFLLALAAALVAGPVYLAYRFGSWTFLLLILIIPGVWLGKFAVVQLRSAIRKNRLLSRYKLFADRIEYRVYNHTERTVSEDTVLFDRIDRVYVSKYIAQYHYAYRKSKMTEKQPYFHILPILYVVYRSATGRRVLKVPFYENFDTEIWLKELQNRGIALWATNKLLSDLPEEEQLRLLEDASSTMPFPFEHHLQKELDLMLAELERKESAARGNGPGDAAPAYPQHNAAAESGAAKGFARFKPKPSTWIVCALLVGFIVICIRLADTGAIPSDSTGLCFIVLVVAATVYQFMANPLTYRVPLRFLLIALLGWAIVGAFIPGSSSGPGEDFYISAIAAIVFLAIFIWPIFGILYWLRRKRAG